MTKGCENSVWTHTLNNIQKFVLATEILRQRMKSTTCKNKKQRKGMNCQGAYVKVLSLFFRKYQFVPNMFSKYLHISSDYSADCLGNTSKGVNHYC